MSHLQQIYDVDIKLLRLFMAIVRCGGFSSAQNQLNMSQSTISHQMSQLEERLGLVLCQRGRGGFSLTREGNAVFSATERLLAAVETFRQEVGTITHVLSGDLSIGVVDNTITDRSMPLTTAIREFRKLGGDVNIHITVDSPEHLIADVIQGKLHLAIGLFPVAHSGLNHTPLYREKHCLYCASSHPFYHATPSLYDLAECPAVLRSYMYDNDQKYIGNGTRNAYANNIEALVTLILTGSYIGFLPEHYARKWLENGDLKVLHSDTCVRYSTFDLVTARKQPDTLVLKQFIQLFRSLLNQHHPSPKNSGAAG